MRRQYDHAYPPGEWTVDDVARALADTDESFPLPTFDDEAVWADIRRDDLTGPAVERLLDRAAEERGAPVPALPARRYLDFDRTGNRRRYQRPNRERLSRLSAFTLAECFEREGRYLDDILDYAWAICEQSTWLLPAHLGGPQNRDGLPGVVPDADRTVALTSTGTAELLAEVDYLLGDRLHPALRERVRHEVDRRVFRPYEARDDHWWLSPPANNWNAVCNAGVGIAALHLCDDRDRIAGLLAKAVDSLRHYLADFDESGCTAEGIHYWNYGFGHYVKLAAHFETRTDGALSLLSPPIVRKIARYPLKTELSPGSFVPFSDVQAGDEPFPFATCWLGDRLDQPGLVARGRRSLESETVGKGLPGTLRTLAWCRGLPDGATVPDPDRVTYLDGFDWWIARAAPADPDGLVVAAKGGHNDESHNHNDCGTFVVHAGGESLLTDLGAPVYDRDFFSEKRYEYLAARSLGHSVPHVNGCEQVAGEDRTADVVDRSADDASATIEFELADCYPNEAGLETLRRRVELAADAERVVVEDRVRFDDDAPDRRFESVLVSYAPMAATDDGFAVTGDGTRARVDVEPDAEVTVERLDDAIDKSHNSSAESDYRDVWRAFVAAPEARETTLRLTVTPTPLD